MGFSDHILFQGQLYQCSLSYDVSITTWALATSPIICKVVAYKISLNEWRDTFEQFIAKLYSHDVNLHVKVKIDIFFDEFKDRQNKTRKTQTKYVSRHRMLLMESQQVGI